MLTKPDIMRREFIVHEDGAEVEWFDTLAEATGYAEGLSGPTYVTERVEYYTDERIVWSSDPADMADPA